MSKPPVSIGIVMDPIGSITPKKDTSFAMVLEAQARGWRCLYFEQRDLSISDGVAYGHGRPLSVIDQASDFFTLGEPEVCKLGDLDAILMRKDPPFDMEYIYTTYILDRAALDGALIVNDPGALRDMNEKAYTAWFADLAPATLITRSMSEVKAFAAQHGRIVVKPLDGMGGRSIFSIRKGDQNTNVILETLTDYGQQFCMAQTYIPEIVDGDKRIIIVDGKPCDFMLARVPNAEDGRGNLVMGATGEGRPLSARDREIAERVGPELERRGVLFAGLDVIGDYLTEINVTSPTGVRELDHQFELNLAGTLLDAVERRLS